MNGAEGMAEGCLRLGVKGGDCSGLSYTINFDDKIGLYDTVHDIDGIKVVVDAKSTIYLQGTRLDFQKDLTGSAFKFVNPKRSEDVRVWRILLSLVFSSGPGGLQEERFLETVKRTSGRRKSWRTENDISNW